MSFDVLERLNPSFDKEQVIISRFWSNPQITVTVNRDRITVYASMEDFVDAVIAELDLKAPEPKKLTGLRAWLLSELPSPEQVQKEYVAKSIRKAVHRVIEKLKDATSQVM